MTANLFTLNYSRTEFYPYRFRTQTATC